MGVRLINWANRSHYNREAGVPAAVAYKCEALYDGGVDLPWSPHLPANEIWVDATAVFRQGINFGASIQYLAESGTCAVYGILSGREYIRQILDPAVENAALPDILEAHWAEINPALPPKEIIPADGIVFDIYRLVFTEGVPAAVVFVSA